MIEVYSYEGCKYCVMAKNLLDAKGVGYTEVHIDKDIKQLDKLRALGLRTVPQIFLDGEHLGGYTDLEQNIQYVCEVYDRGR